jgi:hypothetical protein
MQRQHRDDNQRAFPPASRNSDIAHRESQVASRPSEAEHHAENPGSSPDRHSGIDRLGLILAINPVRCEMKTLLLATNALAGVTAANLSPAMANRFGPFVGIDPDNPE